MASLMQQDLGCIHGQDCLNEFEALEIDNNLLISILDESHVVDDQECDDERLSSVIRSLEAEIDPIVIDEEDHDSSLELEWNVSWEDSHQFSKGTGQSNCSTNMNPQDLDYNWMEMDDMYGLHGYEGGVGGIIEFGVGGVRDYYSQIPYGSNYLEDHGFGALWQENN